MVPLDRLNPGSRSRTASTAAGLNGKTLRWSLAARIPISGLPAYFSAGMP